MPRIPCSRALRRRAIALASLVVLLAACHDRPTELLQGPNPPAPPTGESADSTGVIIASVSTTGADLDPDGYTFTVDTFVEHTASLDSTVVWDSIPQGTHGVGISGLAANCSLVNPPPDSVTLTARDTAIVAFHVACVARSLAFVSNRSGRYQIYTIHSDSSGLAQLGDGQYDDQSPSWSSDGAKLVFSRRLTPDTTAIYIMNADGSGATLVTRAAGLEWLPTLSPDGSRIAFQFIGNGQISVYGVNPDGSDLTKLADSVGYADRPTWSPDGTHILYSSTRTGVSQLYSMKPDGSDKLLVPTPTAQAMAPMYSPDGARITYVGEDADGTKRIHIMNADGTHDAAITDGSTLVFQPAWSPDGLKLAYVELASDGSNNYDIYIVNANGGGKGRLTSAPAVDVFPVWRP